jgi:DNA-binding MarR family transcriptional regulator
LENEREGRRPADTPSVQRTMELLNEQLSDPALRSSARILILMLLSVHKSMSLVELERFTGLGRSSLRNHLGKLEAIGYVKTKVTISFVGKRQVIEMTERGLESCRILLDRISSIDV